MMPVEPSIEFFDGIYEELNDVSLQRDTSTGDTPYGVALRHRIVLLRFKRLKSIEQFQSYTNRFSKALRLTDEEGAIEI